MFFPQNPSCLIEQMQLQGRSAEEGLGGCRHTVNNEAPQRKRREIDGQINGALLLENLQSTIQEK